MNSKNIVIVVLLLALIGAVAYLVTNNEGDTVVVVEDTSSNTDKEATKETEPVTEPVTDVVISADTRGDESIIGTSEEGLEIKAYHFGEGGTELLFVGGTHGGYSWNTTLVGYELVDYLDANPNVVPDNVTVTVIPVLNPDGLKATVGTVGRFDKNDALAVSESTRTAGRFNSNEVDLNRNFDCDWKASATWKSQTVSGGDEAFSESEAAALRDYVNTYNPAAAVVWFSAEGKVYPSACDSVPSKASVELAATFASAASYGVQAEFDAYAITGDMVNWMAKEGIPAISVLLSDHKNTEWSKNKAGFEAVLKAYAK